MIHQTRTSSDGAQRKQSINLKKEKKSRTSGRSKYREIRPQANEEHELTNGTQWKEAKSVLYRLQPTDFVGFLLNRIAQIDGSFTFSLLLRIWWSSFSASRIRSSYFFLFSSPKLRVPPSNCRHFVALEPILQRTPAYSIQTSKQLENKRNKGNNIYIYIYKEKEKVVE